MNVLLIILTILLLVLTYLLLAPFYLEINSVANVYRIRFHTWAWLRVHSTQGSVFFEIKIFWWKRPLGLSSQRTKSKKPNKKLSHKKKIIPIHRIWAVIKSFKIDQCYASIDTGDQALNGILYPFIYWVRRLINKDVAINFCDRNEIILQVRNNFFKVIMAYVKS